MLEKPILAAKVTSLDLYPRVVQWRVRKVRVEADTLSIAAPHKLGNILEFASIQVSEYAVAGAILRQLPT